MTEWLAMGGYAAYVWPVFGVAVLTIAVISILPIYLHKRLREEIKRDIAEESTAESTI